MKNPTQYTIEPAKGQALLNFQGRRLPSQIDLFETTLVEEVRQKGQKKLLSDTHLNADFRNLLIHGDCLSACAYLKSQNIKVDLVYIDPPFASGANYAKKIFLRTGNGKAAMENDTKEIGEEIMYGDIWQKEDYLNWLYERLLAIRDVMNETASIYVHLDWHIGHYVKLLLDEVFGEMNFKNEIIWGYTGPSVIKNAFPRKHDSIYFYSKSDESFFNGAFVPHKSGLHNTGQVFGDMETENEEKVKEFLERGKMIEDWWVDLFPVDRVRSEITDYNTQKPETLLERIIKASSDKGMLIADFFSGSGTTAKVAHESGRKFIACDIGINAIQTTRDRLAEAKAELDVLKINDGVRLFRNPAQTVTKLFSLLEGFKERTELALGEFWDGGILNKKGTFTPVKFSGIDKKLTKELVDVIIEEVITIEDDNPRTLEDGKEYSIPDVKIIYAYKETDINQGYVNKAIRQSKKTGIKAELVSLDELLSQKADALYSPDNAVIEMKKDNNHWKVEIKKIFSSYLKNKMDDFNNKKTKSRQTTIEENGNGEEPATGIKKIEISAHGLELIESVQFDTTLRKDGVWTSNLDYEDKAGVKNKIKAIYKLHTDKFKMKIRNIAGDEIIIESSDICTK